MAKNQKLTLIKISGYHPVTAVLTKEFHKNEHLQTFSKMESNELKNTSNSITKKLADVRVLFTKKH